jgi:hypothetical protein
MELLEPRVCVFQPSDFLDTDALLVSVYVPESVCQVLGLKRRRQHEYVDMGIELPAYSCLHQPPLSKLMIINYRNKTKVVVTFESNRHE